MALKAKDGTFVIVECEKLIADLKADMKEFGAEKIFAAWVTKDEKYDIDYISNYDFLCPEFPIGENETKPGERIMPMKAAEILLC